MQTIRAAEARSNFAALLRRVSESGERVLIERRGKPCVAVVPVEDLERIESGAEHALRESELRFRDFAESASDWFWETDAQGAFSYVSAKFFKQMRLDPKTVLGETRSALVGEAEFKAFPEKWRRHFEALDKHHAFRDLEYEIVGNDGESRFIKVSGVPVFDAAGAFQGYRGADTDVTERRRAETAFRDREARLRKLQTTLLHVSRSSALGQLASALARELNQPLTAIMNYVQASRRLMLRDARPCPAKILSSMEKAIDQADRAGGIIRRLRGFIEPGESELLREDINLVVEEAATLGLAAGRDKGILVKLNLGADLPLLFMDKIQIQQVVVNLVRNSVDAMAGSKRRELTLTTLRRKNATVEVAIHDTGTGVPEKIENNLFKPFVTTKAEGMGIGLSISHAIIDAHGGHLVTARNPDGGTTFSFSLPAAMPTDEDHDRKADHLHPG